MPLSLWRFGDSVCEVQTRDCSAVVELKGIIPSYFPPPSLSLSLSLALKARAHDSVNATTVVALLSLTVRSCDCASVNAVVTHGLFASAYSDLMAVATWCRDERAGQPDLS